MPVITIRGRVYPPAVRINTPEFDLKWRESSEGPELRYVISVQNSVVNIRCTAEQYDPDGNHSLYTTRGLEITRSILDPLAFAQGIGLFVLLEDLITPSGLVKQILPQNAPLQRLATAFKDDFEGAQRIVMGEPELYLAMNELIVAITLPGQIEINCGRAIEGLRKIMVPVDPKRKLGWAEMQDKLNLERSYIEYVTNASTSPRHGDRRGISQQAAQELLERAWTIMNRFVEYRKRDSQKLPPQEFPVLY